MVSPPNSFVSPVGVFFFFFSHGTWRNFPRERFLWRGALVRYSDRRDSEIDTSPIRIVRLRRTSFYVSVAEVVWLARDYGLRKNLRGRSSGNRR